MRAALEAPAGFSFPRTVHSHGWCTLAPFRTDPGGAWVETVVALPQGGARRIRLNPTTAGGVLEVPGRTGTAAVRRLTGAARRMLNLDLDLTEFYRATDERPEMRWIARAGAGRLLRAPTAFEDLAKLVLTTNCSWALTTRMVQALVDRYGERAPDGSRAFPGAAAIAGAGERALREEIRTGCRAPLLARLARRVADGEVDPESWESAARDPAELRVELLELPGVGPYVAENLLRLQGRPAGLALDTWLRGKYARVYHGGRRVTDRTIGRRYARLGRWAGLALWCEMTRDWFDGDRPSAAWDSLE